MDTQYEDLKGMLQNVISLLEAMTIPKQTAAPTKVAMGFDGKSDIAVPQPDEIHEAPGDCVVHFGKNKGRRLDELAQNSLSFYAAKYSPQPTCNNGMGPNGQFWPNDWKLLQCARTLWHLNQGTLVVGSRHEDDHNIPF